MYNENIMENRGERMDKMENVRRRQVRSTSTRRTKGRKVNRTQKKKRSNIYILFLVILILLGLGIAGTYLRSKFESKALERAWKDKDEEAFRALFINRLESSKGIEKEENTEDQKTETQEDAGEENIRYISEEEYRSIVQVYEETEEEPDLLKTMMEYGTLKVKESGWDKVTLNISVPDITILIEEIAQEEIPEEKGYIKALIEKMEENSSDLIMKDKVVTLEKDRNLGKTAYLLSEELIDGIYGGLLSGFSDMYEEYYKVLGGAVR